jgi:nucleoside-diphosphate-sugar epimerase
MKCLLTGGTGFVGRNFLLRAVREKAFERIWVTVRDPEKLRAQWRDEGFADLPDELVPVVGDATRWNLGEAAGADVVVHGAGSLSARSLDEYRAVNVEGTLRLLREVSPHARVLILSSQAAAGPCRDGEAIRDEESLESPVTWYGQSKLEMERRIAAEFGDRRCLILRPPMVLGPRDQATLPLFKMAKSPLRVKPGFRRKWYSYVSVEDLVDAVFAAVTHPQSWPAAGVRRYFVTSGGPISDAELIATAARAVRRRGWLVHIPQGMIWLLSRVVDRVPAWRAAVPNLSADRAREIWPSRWVVSDSAFQRDFGWKPAADLFSVLSETGVWYQRTGQLSV